MGKQGCVSVSCVKTWFLVFTAVLLVSFIIILQKLDLIIVTCHRSFIAQFFATLNIYYSKSF